MLACKFLSFFALRLTCKVLGVFARIFVNWDPSRVMHILDNCVSHNAFIVYVFETLFGYSSSYFRRIIINM